ncbi:hypothetical protein [Helicobacter sp. 23-1045]
MTNLDLTKKLQIFFGDFERKDIENIYNISLDSLPQTIKNEVKFYPQKDFLFVEYIIDKTHKDERFGDLTKMARYGIVENMATIKQVILTNYPALLSYFLCEVATEKIDADDMVFYYRNKSKGIFKCYAKFEKKAYLVNERGEKVNLYGVCDCENELNF